MVPSIIIGLLCFSAVALLLTNLHGKRMQRLKWESTPTRVEYQRAVKTRSWRISQGELNAYVKHDERRTNPRRGGTPTAIHFFEPGVRKLQEGFVLDRGEQGLRIAVLRDIPAHRVIRIKADRSPPDTPWVDAVVCWCGAVQGGFDIGCKFKQPVPISIRLLFG